MVGKHHVTSHVHICNQQDDEIMMNASLAAPLPFAQHAGTLTIMGEKRHLVVPVMIVVGFDHLVRQTW